MSEKTVDAKQIIARVLLPYMMMGIESPKNIGYITAFKVDSDKLVIYTKDQDPYRDKGRIILGKKGINDTSILGYYVKKYPRINIVNKGKASEKERVIYTLKIDEKQLDGSEDGTLGTQYIVRVDSVYVEEGSLSKADPRPDNEKLLRYSYSDLDSFVVMQLILNDYQEGVYKKDSRTVFGKKNGKLERVCQYIEVKDGTRKIDVGSKLKVNYYKYSKTDLTSRYRVPKLSDIEVNKNLMSIMKKKSGIIVLDNLMATDLLNSKSFQEMTDYKNVLFIGEDLCTKSEYLMVDTDPTMKKELLPIIKKMNYDIIVDDDSKLAYGDILELAENSLVVISENTTNIELFIKKFDILGNKEFENFIDKTLYIGSIYTQYGLELTNSSRRLLKLKDLRLFSDITSVETIENTVKYIYSNKKVDEIDEILIKPGETYMTSGDTMRKLNISPFYQSDIVYTLWRLEKQLNVDLLSSIEDKGYCIAISNISFKDEGKDVNLYLKFLFVGDRTKIHLKVSPILLKPVLIPKEITAEVQKGINVILGNAGEGKTNTVKNIANSMQSKKRVFVLDREYDIVEDELKSIETYISRNVIDKNFIKHYSPDVIIINSEIDDEEMGNLLSVVTKNQIVILILTGTNIHDKLDLLPSLKRYVHNNDGTHNGSIKIVIQPKLMKVENTTQFRVSSEKFN